jgi:hypothetical protein
MEIDWTISISAMAIMDTIVSKDRHEKLAQVSQTMQIFIEIL